MMGGRGVGHARHLAETLIPATLKNARRAPFWAQRIPESCSVQDFLDLPLVQRADIQRAGRSAQYVDGGGWSDYFTGGTTKSPLAYRVNDAEQQYLADFFGALSADWSGLRPRGVGFSDLVHGGFRHIPTPLRLHWLSLHSPGGGDFARTLLAEDFEEAGVEAKARILFGGERAIRIFTADSADRHPNGMEGVQLDHVLIYGAYLTPHVRAGIEQFWRCGLVDRYGMSEVVGGCTQDTVTGWYHFDPCLYGQIEGSDREFIDAGTGIGRLVVTPLYPFQQGQPLVKYDTGDIVEFTYDDASAPGELLIRPLGRASQGIPSPDRDDWLLLPNTIHAAIDDLHEVRRKPWMSDAQHLRGLKGLGYPVFDVHTTSEGAMTSVTVDLALRPRTGPRAQARVLQRVRDRIDRNLRGGATGHHVSITVRAMA